MAGTLVVLGLLLCATAAVVALADSDGLSARMPTQVPPRRLAWYPAIAGVVLLVAGLVGSVVP